MSKSFFAVDKLNVIGKECFPFISFVLNDKNYLVYYSPSGNKKCEVYVSKISSDNKLVDILSSEVDKFIPIVRDMVVLPSTYKKEDDINNLIKDFVDKYGVKFLTEVPEIGEQSFHNVSSLFEIELDYIEYVDYFYSSALPRVNFDDEKSSDDIGEEELAEKVDNDDEGTDNKESEFSEGKVSSNMVPSIADSLANYNALNGATQENINNPVNGAPTTNANVLEKMDASNYFGNIPSSEEAFTTNYGFMNSKVNFDSGVNVGNSYPFFETNNGVNPLNNSAFDNTNNSYSNYGFNMTYAMNNSANNSSYGVSNVAINSNNPNFHPVQSNLVENKNAGFASSKYIIIGTICLIIASVVVAISIVFVNNL